MTRYLGTVRGVQVSIALEPRDLWVGVYRGRRYWEMGVLWLPLYVCLVPTIVVRLTIRCHGRREGEE